MNRPFAALAICGAAFVLAACEDEPNAPTAPTTEAAAAAPVLAPDEALRAAPASFGGTSVCTSYLRERKKLLGQIKAQPQSAELLKRAKSLTSIITDACN
jgi:hypothetical protein